MTKQDGLWGGLGCLEGTLLRKVKYEAGEAMRAQSTEHSVPAQHSWTRLTQGFVMSPSQRGHVGHCCSLRGVHKLPQPRPLKANKGISKCHRIQQGCSCCAHPTFCSLFSQNLRPHLATVLRPHLATVLLPQGALVLFVPYRPSPSTDCSYLAHPDLQEELRIWDICTFLLNL